MGGGERGCVLVTSGAERTWLLGSEVRFMTAVLCG